MGKLLPGYKKALFDELKTNISSNTSQYYVFASNPVEYTGNTPTVTSDDYSTIFYNDWNLLFGKKLTNNNIMPIIKNIEWTSNTIYSRYDNTSNTMYNESYYVITAPSVVGADYEVYKCIDNANGSPSLQKPNQKQPSSFQKSDGYVWRYITSITDSVYQKFATESYFPIYPNTTIVAGAYNYSGVEVVMITNAGSGYISYNDGTVKSIVNSTLIQIESTASTDNDFYTDNGIYIYNTLTSTSQLKTVKNYVSNSSGNWVYLDSAANATNITPSITQYKISPKVVFDTDADSEPQAYTVVNTYSNSISQIVIIDTGYGVSRANVSIVSNTIYGSGASAYAIVPSPGGHGSNPEVELNMQGYAVNFSFSNTESGTIPSNISYNKIGIMKNIHTLNTNGTKGSVYSANTFKQILSANVTLSSFLYQSGEIVKGQTSGSLGRVVFCNTSVLYLVGDKTFSNNENIVSSNGNLIVPISINTLGNIYAKDIYPLYVQNINNITRSNTQSETFKLIVKI